MEEGTASAGAGSEGLQDGIMPQHPAVPSAACSTNRVHVKYKGDFTCQRRKGPQTKRLARTWAQRCGKYKD